MSLEAVCRSCGTSGVGPPLFPAYWRRSPDCVAERVLGLVVLGDCRNVVVACTGQVLLCLDVLQHVPDTELLSLPCQPQTLVGCGDLPLHRGQLVGDRPDSLIGLDDLAGDLVLQLLIGDLCTAQPRLCGMN